MIGTSLASVSRILARLLEHYQISPEAVFREAGLDPALMDEPRGRYRVKATIAAWAKAEERIGNPCFGLKAAEYWHAPDMHALGYAFLASSTLRTALERIARYVAVVNDLGTFAVDDDGERVIFSHRFLGTDLMAPPPFEDARWALVLGMCRESYSETLTPVEVRLRHPETPCKGDYARVFRCPVHFGAETSAILFSRADLDHPLPAANRELARANDQILSDFLAALTEDDLITQVKEALTHELPSGSPTDESIARTVHLSTRTLQRRLAAAGTSYAQLLDGVRRELAEQYVTDPSRSLSEITFLLGFSELSAFSRAFKRWTGKAPTAVREAAPAEPRLRGDSFVREVHSARPYYQDKLNEEFSVLAVFTNARSYSKEGKRAAKLYGMELSAYDWLKKGFAAPLG